MLPAIAGSPYSTDELPNSYAGVTSYNNFYEFGTDKSDPAALAHTLRTRPWTTTIDGEVHKPRVIDYSGVVIGTDHPHELATGGRAVAVFYIEPEGEDGRTVGPATSGAPLRLPGRLVAALRAVIAERAGSELDSAGASRLFADVMERVAFTATPRRPLDPRVAAAVRALRSAQGTYPASCDQARTLGVSASRLRHLFAEQIGMSFRRYTLWLRLNAAIDEVLHGASITTAAHAAGFADSAHLSRTFRRMFGIVPSAAPQIRRLLPVAR